MKLIRLELKGFKNLTGDDNWFKIDFTVQNGMTVLIGNNGSGKSNIIEAISSIFTGLYKIATTQRKPKFNYLIEYSLEDIIIKVKLIDGTYEFYIDNTKILKKDFFSIPEQYLPSKIISSYSGEEIRLWNTYYKHLFSDFTNLIKQNRLRNLPEQKLIYINSDYWNEALLVFLISDLENNQTFISDNLKINEVVNITFNFNQNNIKKYRRNMITNFVKSINPDINKTHTVTLEEFKNIVSNEYEYSLFIKLISASVSELITSITIKFNDTLTTEDLSEGQKKQLLIKAILEFIADKNSLILLDEPDSHIHVANKCLFKTMLLEDNDVETILTTHSPTLMHIFDNNLVHLEAGQINGREKAQILQNIAGDIMSITEQQIVLNSTNDILLVEGKTDEMHIEIALKRLQEDYPEYLNLEFEYIPLGGADGLNLFVDKFTPKDNQTIIALLDRDETGKEIIKDILDDKNIDFRTFKYKKEKNIFISCYAKKENFTRADFVIEDYYDIDFFTKFLMKDVIDFKSIPQKNKRKTDFAEYCISHSDKSIFKNYKNLFDLILEIKGQ